jgi:hypothetical protein
MNIFLAEGVKNMHARSIYIPLQILAASGWMTLAISLASH